MGAELITQPEVSGHAGWAGYSLAGHYARCV
jgi:hypothetical protein